MNLQITTYEEYSKLFPTSPIVFNSADFAQLNASKCDQIHFLLFIDSKLRLGLIVGEHQDRLSSPFSAPFGGFTQADNSFIKLEVVEQAINLLKEFAQERGKSISITLPPIIYNRDMISKSVSALIRSGFVQEYVDLSYYIPISDTATYVSRLKRNARKNLKKAEQTNMSFQLVQSDQDRRLAYDIIKLNRDSRGYPLRMSYEEIISTTDVIRVNFFLLKSGDRGVASAIVFEINRSVSQIVYWGNIDDSSELRPMNILPLRLVEHYHSIGVNILDIGPSTEFGVPNYGLCDFKSSIGCESDLKFKFTFNPLK
ncbi:MAG: hypothetical protein ACRCZM_05390 [Bacteroidales bacterium]